MSMALSTGLVSGLDTGALIDALIRAEAAPQNALKSRLSATQTAASAYRTVNTTFLAVTSSAEAVLKPELWTSAKATSSAGSVAVSASPGAAAGSLTFKVASVAETHSMVSSGRWSSTSTAAGLGSLTVKSLDGLTTKGTITLDGTESLTAAAAKINAAGLDLTASVVQTNANQYALQVTSTKSGGAASFSLSGADTFTAITEGKDAELKVGSTTAAYSVFSATNTFEGLLAGASLTVSKPEDTAVTVKVTSDPDAVASRVQALVDAANSAITTVKTYTSNATGSTAALKGDFSVSSLAGRLQAAVSHAVGEDSSPALVGFQLTRDGKIVFDKAKFVTALKETPDLAQRMVLGTPATTGTGGAAGTPAVEGIAERLLDLTKAASDSTTGTLVSLANGQDSRAKDIESRIEAWNLRLEKRRETLQRQYTAMETALSSLQNQSTWLAGQINALPSNAK
jgi:flagellar capping protein FliD